MGDAPRTTLRSARWMSCCGLLALALAAAASRADDGEAAPDDFLRPLTLAEQPESIYPPPKPFTSADGLNKGGVNLDLNVNYMTDYVYRGVDRSEPGSIDPAETSSGAEDAPNLQFDGKLSFNLDRLPHPYVGLFVNVFNDDPVSRFQEVRPYVGLDWNVRPLLISAGWQSFIYPERDDFNTAEIYAKVELDDSYLFRTDGPIFSPYGYAAYDYDLYDGLYIEAGVHHDFPIEGTGVVLTALANVGFVSGNQSFTAAEDDDSGFQHYEFGFIGTYSLNPLLNISRRYGEWKLRGYLFYTDGLEKNLRAETQLWGGMGIGFEY